MHRAQVLAVAVGLAAGAFAGCLSSEPDLAAEPLSVRKRAPGVPSYVSERLPEPILLCYDEGTRCNLEMTPDPGREGNEVTIAVDPTKPKNIVGGAKDYYPPDAGECVWDGVYVTHDAGRTPFSDRNYDGSPWRQLDEPDPSKVNYASQFWCMTDPVAYFNTAGTYYYLVMAYQGDRATGSKIGKDVNNDQPGALNDWAFNRAAQIVAISDDGGDTFHTFTPVFDGSFPIDFHDKGWIAASSDGVIHVAWTSFLLPGTVYFRSTDGGQSFGDPTVLAPTGMGSGIGTFVDVGPGDEVYASWFAGNGINFRRSMDQGLTWDPLRTVIDVVPRSTTGLSSRDFRLTLPAMATDRWRDSPYAGAIYFVWQDGGRSDATDILFSASFDQGATFTEPLVLNDDYLPNGSLMPNNWQWFPSVSVSPLGVIDVTWMDTRLAGTAILRPDNGGTPGTEGREYLRLDQFHTYSLDGGKTWSPNFRIRDVDDQGWDPQECHHQNGKIFIGDYIDIDSSWGAAHPVWPDARDEVCDVYTAIVQRPIFPAGMDQEKMDVLRQRLVAEGLVEADHPFLNQ